MLDNGKDMISFRKTQEQKSNTFTPLIYSLILAFGVMLGYLVNSLTVGKTQPFIGRSYDKIQDIIRYVQLKYVDTVNTDDLTEKTIDQLLSNLDPHSVYIPARDLAETNEQLQGNFEGIGIEFFIVQDTITVVNAIPGGPSEVIGLRAGDRIVLINDSVVAGIKIKEVDVKKKLRGPSNTQVKVTVLRGRDNEQISYTITRGKIPLVSLDAGYMINNTTGYIRISNFSSTTAEEFIVKLKELTDAGMKNLILDLRGNPGGYLQAATAMVDELLDEKKLIVYTKGKSAERIEYKAHKPGLFEQGKVCVLLDQWSASASEIMAGAIQDWDRGVVIGRNSFGKGLVQEQFQLRDGSGLRLTVARYYTPSGRCIQRDYKNGREQYYNEIDDKYLTDEFAHYDTTGTKDSTVYTTLVKGRKMYGGGGIHPDIFVPVDTSPDALYLRKIRTYIPEFTYKYSSQHPEVLEQYRTKENFAQNFTVGSALLAEFYNYAKGAGLKADEGKSARTAEKTKLYIKAALAKQMWRLEGYYFIANADDEVVQRALQELGN